jgi:queuine tRNA-ribosyltransferase
MKFDLKKKIRSRKPEREVLLLITGDWNPILCLCTVASVKGVHQRELKEDIRYYPGKYLPLIFASTNGNLEKAGGLHKFMNWDRNIWRILHTKCIHSANRKLRKKAKFKSHIDGSYHFFTPENVMEIQRTIGADIIMAFDECTPYPWL